MTNSKVNENAVRLIDEILKLTNEKTIRNNIDEPIDKALADFNFEIKNPIIYQDFIQYIGSFITVLYGKNLWSLQKVSDDKACAEAMSILETGYQSSKANGFYAAFLDACNPMLSGPELVLRQLSEIIKARLRMKYIKWIYVSLIEGADWMTRCSMAETLIERWRPFLPPDILKCPPIQFADHLPDLINILGSSDNILSEMLGTDMNWISHES